MFKFPRVLIVRGAAALLGTALVAGLGLLAGCPSQSTGSSASVPAPTAASVGLAGSVHGGRQAIAGATVYVYDIPPTTSATIRLLGTTTTSAAGTFGFALPASVHDGDTIAFAAQGGDATGDGVDNPAIELTTVAGVYCSAGAQCEFPDFVNINELTTAASAYSLSGFVTGSNLTDASNFTGYAAPGFPNAVRTFLHLVDPSTGEPSSFLLNACANSNPDDQVNCTALKTLDTLANVVAGSCVNAVPGDCTDLFAQTTSSNPGTPTSNNTFQALLNIVQQNDVRNNSEGIFNLTPPAQPIFSPSLGSAPDAWILALNYTGGGLDHPAGLAIDGAGSVWAVNPATQVTSLPVLGTSAHAGSVTKLNPVGAPATSASPFGGGGIDVPVGIAIDTNGNVWTTSLGNDSLNEFDVDGQPQSGNSGYRDSAVDNPYGIAVGSDGTIWIASHGHFGPPYGQHSAINTYRNGSGFETYTDSAIQGPLDIAANCNCGAWATSNPASKLVQIDAGGTIDGHAGGGMHHPTGLALDADGNVWVGSHNGNNGSLTKFDSDGNVLLGPISEPGYLLPAGLATDADGHVWIATPVNAVYELDKNGNWLSPSGGYTAGGLDGAFRVAVDPSGNLWVSNNHGNSVTEYIGVAAPTRTPLVDTANDGFAP